MPQTRQNSCQPPDQPMLARYIAPLPNLKLADALAQLSELEIPVGWTTARAASLRYDRLLASAEG